MDKNHKYCFHVGGDQLMDQNHQYCFHVGGDPLMDQNHGWLSPAIQRRHMPANTVGYSIDTDFFIPRHRSSGSF